MLHVVSWKTSSHKTCDGTEIPNKYGHGAQSLLDEIEYHTRGRTQWSDLGNYAAMDGSSRLIFFVRIWGEDFTELLNTKLTYDETFRKSMERNIQNLATSVPIEVKIYIEPILIWGNETKFLGIALDTRIYTAQIVGLTVEDYLKSVRRKDPLGDNFPPEIIQNMYGFQRKKTPRKRSKRGRSKRKK
jgi:hypothetical protein